MVDAAVYSPQQNTLPVSSLLFFNLTMQTMARISMTVKPMAPQEEATKFTQPLSETANTMYEFTCHYFTNRNIKYMCSLPSPPPLPHHAAYNHSYVNAVFVL